MTGLEATAVVFSGLLVCCICALLGGGRRAQHVPRRLTRVVLWIAIASPLLVVLVPPESRPRVLISGPTGAFDGLRALMFGAAIAGIVVSAWRVPARPWAAGLAVASGALVAVGVCILHVL